MKIVLISFIINLLFIPDLLFPQKNNTNAVKTTVTDTNIVEPLTTQEKRFIFINTILSNSTKKELNEICEKLKISSKGAKEELLVRIKSFLSIETLTEKEKKEKEVEETLKDVVIVENAEEGEFLQVDAENQEYISASGEVHLRYNKIRLKADWVKLNTKTKEMLCEGNVILYDGTKEMTGEKIFYNLDTGMGIIYYGKSKIGDLIYKGKKIKKVEEDTYIISKGVFTSCDEEPPHYYIEAKKLWVYPDDKLVLLDAYYVVSGVKIFWIPLYFKFEKGTGIITSWGKRSVDGWYMQNTYRYRLNKTTKGNIKFDHYQKRGEYLGVDFHQKSEDAELLFGTSGANEKKMYPNNSNINPDTGEVDKQYEGKVSFKNKVTFNRDSEYPNYNTALRASIFRQTDYAYIQNFEMYRSIEPGFHFNERPIYHNDLYNQDVNKWYVDLTDTRKNSSFSIRANWNFEWNYLSEEYRMLNANLPKLSYSLSGVLGEKPAPSKSESGTNKKKSNGFGFYPKIRYNTSIMLSHMDYYDNDENYLKSLDTRDFKLNLSRAFSLYNFITYMPSVGVGNQAFWPYNVDDNEKNNCERMTYSYGNLGEVLRLGPTRFFFNFNHSFKYRFKEPPKTDEYGKVVSHKLDMSQTTTPINGIRFNASTSYNLRTKRNEKLKEIERDRFKDLNTQLSISAIKNVNISERYIYSIRHDKPLTSNLNFTYSVSDIPLWLIEKLGQFRFNSLWNHDIQNPRSSKLNVNIGLKVILNENWKLNISTQSLNERLYLYSKPPDNISEIERSEYRNFFTDALNSINIFQPAKMKDSYFKLRNANISLNHDLHCWQMGVGYTLSQRYFNYGRITQYPYFEHSFWLKINMKIQTELGVDEKKKTEQPEIEEE